MELRGRLFVTLFSADMPVYRAFFYFCMLLCSAGILTNPRIGDCPRDRVVISIHRNAYLPETAQGVETYVHPNASSQAIQLAQGIQRELQGVGFVDRGVKTANFQVLRETKAPAVLVELGFIDNTKDNLLFDMKKEEIIQALVGAILAQVELNQPSGEENSIRLDDAIDVLGEHGIVDSPAYWQQYAKPNQVVHGDHAALLLKRMAAFLIRDRNLEQ